MLNHSRKAELLAIINENGTVLVKDASKKLSVTEETIRRDLKSLEDQGLILRTHGGAISLKNSNQEFPLEIRQNINIVGKNAIGKTASSLVSDGDTIILDASTSSLFLAKNIKDKKRLTVITNSEKVIQELMLCQEIKIISTGGVLRRESMSFSGSFAEETLRQYHSNKVFFSCKGFLPELGLMDSNEQESQIKRIMISRSQRSVFLCDKTKLNSIGCITVATMSQIQVFITDEILPQDIQKQLNDSGIETIIAGGTNE